jgi:predicted phosphodiesterase
VKQRVQQLVFSDVHDRLDIFYKIVEQYDTDTLVFVGDTLDLLKNPCLTKQQVDFLFFINKFNTIFILGNHDNDNIIPSWPNVISTYALNNILVMKSCLFFINDKPGIMVHGHQYDKCVTEHPFFSKMIVKFQKWFDNLFKTDVQNFCRNLNWIRVDCSCVLENKRVLKFLNKIGFVDFFIELHQGREIYPMMSKISDRMLEDLHVKFDIVVAGHTHVPKVKINGKKEYYNCGSFRSKYVTYLTFEDNSFVMNYFES